MKNWIGKKPLPILLLFILVFSSSAMGIGGGPTDHLDNPTPDCGDMDIPITDKGVQTCINVTVDQDCTVNLTFQWLNYSDWTWHTYETYTGINVSGQYCAWHENVTCYTEGDWMTQFQQWSVVANFACPQNYTYNETFYCWFTPELCPLFYIYPPTNNSGLCPCCIPLCVGVNNTHGNLMNLTFWSNLSMGYWDYFYLGVDNVTFAYVPNGTYCFNVPNFILYNYTYYWYVNVTDTVTGEYEVSNIYYFTTAESIEDCDCGDEALTGRGQIIRFGSLHDLSATAFILAIIALLAIFMMHHSHKGKEDKVKEEQEETGR